jgi:hypothetical protein
MVLRSCLRPTRFEADGYVLDVAGATLITLDGSSISRPTPTTH